MARAQGLTPGQAAALGGMLSPEGSMLASQLSAGSDPGLDLRAAGWQPLPQPAFARAPQLTVEASLSWLLHACLLPHPATPEH